MMKAFSFFAFMLVGTSILLGVRTNSYGMQTNNLNYPGTELSAVATTITVDSTTNFPKNGVLWIDTEKIYYTNTTTTTFTGCSRAYSNTTASVHPDNTIVYYEDAGLLNQMFAFDIGSLFDKWGLFAFPVVAINFFTHTIPAMAQGNMNNLFQGNGMGLIVSMWLVFGAGFIFMIFMYLFTARRGV